MKLGIIINSYNNQKTILNAINSISRIPNRKKIKIIVIDDSSTDGSINVLRNEKKKKKIDLLYVNKKNIGISRSRNIGINLCRNTDYITFLDGDDTLNPNFMSFFSKKIKKNSEDLILFNFSYSTEKEIKRNNFFSTNKILRTKDMLNYFNKYLLAPNKNSLFTTCWSKLYRTKFILKKNDQFKENLNLCEDTDFVFRYLNNNKVTRIKYFKFPMYNHSLSKGADNLKKLTFGININLKNQISFLEALKSCKKYLDKKILNKSQLNKKLNHCLGAYTSIYLIRSCLKINSIQSFLNVYFFWKKVLKKKVFFHALKDYSPKKAGGNIILNLFIKNKFYLISVIVAFLISKKRYL